MPLIIPANTLADTGFSVANSCRFNDDDGAYMSQTWGSSGNRKTWTLSMWLKFGKVAPSCRIFSIGDDVSTTMMSVFFTGGDFRVEDAQGGDHTLNFRTNAIYRDPSAWQHFAIICDTTQGTDTNRVKIYHNGIQVTSFSETTLPSENLDTLVNHTTGAATIGARAVSQSGSEFDGYMAEVVMLDGTAAAITDLGEFDEDSPTIWKPIKVSGLTFGTNGFYLDFKDSANLGNDANGGTDFAENNLAATDQATDTPTNNFATWNPLVSSNGTLSEGNVKYATSNSSSNYGYRLSTIGVSSGMWYAEVKYTSSSNQALIGIRSREATAVSHYLGYYDDDYAIYVDGHYYNNNSETTNANASWTSGDIIGIYLDLDNNKLYFSKNGALYSSTGISITAAASTETGFYFFSASEWNSSGNGTFELNTGNPSFSITSGNTDGEYGSFEYTTTITGDGASKTFKALNTKNLAEYGG